MTFPDLTPLTDPLLRDLAPVAPAEDGLSGVALAGLVGWRETHVYADLPPRAKPDPVRLEEADAAYIQHLGQLDGEVLTLHRIGLGATGTRLETVVDRMPATDPAASEIRHGIDAGIRRRMPFGEAPKRPGPEFTGPPAERVRSACGAVTTKLLLGISRGLERKPLMRGLNALVLLEEAAMVIRAGLGGDAAARRRTAMDFALTRYLGAISGLQDAGLEEITAILRETGRAVRLNNAVSDSLDRVRTYARTALSDPDVAEAGRLAERPLPANLQDLYAAATQCRKFRDRELG